MRPSGDWHQRRRGLGRGQLSLLRSCGAPAMAVYPSAAAPMPNPTMPCSLSGVLNTRSRPKRSARPTVQRNTPPNATSSPKQSDLQSRIRARLCGAGRLRHGASGASAQSACGDADHYCAHSSASHLPAHFLSAAMARCRASLIAEQRFIRLLGPACCSSAAVSGAAVPRAAASASAACRVARPLEKARSAIIVCCSWRWRASSTVSAMI